MLKVFLDSSVLVAAAGSQGGGSFKIISLIRERKIEGWLNEGVVAESEDAIRRKLSQEKYKLFLSWLAEGHLKILPFPGEERLQQLREVALKDRHILISAQESKPDYLVSLDKKHILVEVSQKTIPTIKIVTPKEFLRNYSK